MGRLRSNWFRFSIILCFLGSITGCGGSKAGSPIFPGQISITPASSTSLVLGGVLTFSATVQTTSGTNIATPVTFSSSDTSILNLSANGIACAGHWDTLFTACIPGNSGPVTVTATALGASSIPTYVFVHPRIDSIAVNGVLLDGVPVQEPCLSQSQTMTLEAHAYSQGVDITASVGPFTWSSYNASVAAVTPLVDSAFKFPTNRATATAVTPGLTHIFASANGVTSNSFRQAQYTDAQGKTSPVLDFFETCPIQNIALELAAAGSGRTSFTAEKSGAETVIATLTDVMGNSSLPNTNGGIVLSKIPLTWTSSQAQSIGAGTSCTQSCALTTTSAGAATVTASCSPPTCNVGFPEVPTSLSPSQIAACTDFFNFDCHLLIPVPVYASPVFISSSGQIALSPTGAISGVVTGEAAAVSALATSTDCLHEPPDTCTTSLYFPSTAGASAGNAVSMPVAPNSFLFAPAGDKIYMGSDFGSQLVTPGNFGTANSPFSSLGTVTAKVLAVSNSGSAAAFSDTLHTPNQAYVVNTGNSSSTSLNVPSASVAAFSPDGLKTFLVGNAGRSLYVYSSLQALQGPISLTGSGNSIVFSPNGAFAYVAESSAGGGSANLTAFAACNNQPVASVNLPANPILMKLLPNLHLDGRDSLGNPIPDGVHILVLDATGFDIVTSTISVPAPGTLCPQGLQFVSGDPLRTVQRIELGQGAIQPVNFFASPDATQLYVAASNNSTILIYDFISGSVNGGIELQGNATPISADISVDAGIIIVAGSDGLLHEVSTAVGGLDRVQLSFPNLPNILNAFCTFEPTTGPCTLNTALVRP